jgi:glycosyltransferase involved in cell wall biosynthesis
LTRLLVPAFRYAPAIGGAENHARRLLVEIGGRADVEVVALSNGNRTHWLDMLINGERERDEVHEVDGRRVTSPGRWPEPTRRRLRRLAPGYHLPASPVPGWMAGLLAPHVERFVAGRELVHNPFMGREAWSLAFLVAARRAGLPFVFTPLRHQRPLGWSSPAFRRLYAESEAVIALTEHEAAWLEERGARRDRLHVVGVGPLNDAEAPLEPALAASGGEPFVLFLGQLHEYKGFRAVLEAASRLVGRGVRFVFAGPDVRGAAGCFEAAPRSAVYLGRVSDSLRDSLLRGCLALCVPSERESFGGVLVEAWAAGRPVIAGTAAATRELVEEGVDGWVVPQDGGLVADRVARLLADPGLADRMGARGRDKVTRRFSWPVIAGAHLEIYERALVRSRAATA